MRTLILLFLFACSCVSEDLYRQAVSEGEQKVVHAGDEARKNNEEVAKKLAAETEARKKAEEAASACQTRLDETEKRAAEAEKKFETAATGLEQLRTELSGCGKKMKEETGGLAAALAETRAALEDARKAKAAADARAAFFKQLTLKFQKMIEAGSLSIVLRNGRMVLQMSTDVLFDSGKIDIKATGQGALKEVAAVLRTIKDRKFQVAGHSDNLAIHTPEFASNWELSTARAVKVVHFLIDEGVASESLSAAGYSEFDSIAKNATPKGRAKNRRIEITLQPDISELVAFPQK